ncbi:biopolymer transporter ExbD [Candidatus Dependentiae bacterium]|nr:biopolymer transporter ExbD [Candidatus Dependentiae bacterium]
MKIKTKKKREAIIPAASMSDIAFLLIIFFMVSTVFNVDVGVNVVLPQASEYESIIDKQNIHVTIPNQKDPGAGAQIGQVLLEGDPIEIEDLKNKILHLRAENPNIYYVILKVDETVPFQMLNRVMMEIKRTKITKLKLANDFEN